MANRRAGRGLLVLAVGLGGACLVAAPPVDLLVHRGECSGSPSTLENDNFLLLNRGDGSFFSFRFLPDTGHSIAVGDLDGDGITDIATPGVFYLGTGDGYVDAFRYLSLEERTECGGDAESWMAFEDLDRDGHMDFIYACHTRVYLFYGTGDDRLIERGPTFTVAEEFERCESGERLTVGDLDTNGFPDVFFSQPFGSIAIFNEGERTFSTQMYFILSGAILDFDGDGLMDVVGQELFADRFTLMRGTGGRDLSSFEVQELPLKNIPGIGEGIGIPFAVEFHDMDGDGHSDIVFRYNASFESSFTEHLVILYGQEGGRLDIHDRSVIDLPTHREDLSCRLRFGYNQVADIDEDGVNDLILVNYSRCYDRNAPVFSVKDAVWVFRGLGEKRFSEPTWYPGPQYASRVFVLEGMNRLFVRGDADDDGRVNITDAVFLLHVLFLGETPSCGKALDADDDSDVELSDALYILQFLFAGGPPPPAPFPEPGIDETNFRDRLGCTRKSWLFFLEDRK